MVLYGTPTKAPLTTLLRTAHRDVPPRVANSPERAAVQDDDGWGIYLAVLATLRGRHAASLPMTVWSVYLLCVLCCYFH